MFILLQKVVYLHRKTLQKVVSSSCETLQKVANLVFIML